MRNVGIKISEPGKSVLHGSQKDMLLDSTQDCLKLDELKYVDIKTNINGILEDGFIEVAHTFDFIPFVVAFVEYKGGYEMLPFNSFNLVWYDQAFEATVTINEASLRFNFSDLSNPYGDARIYYYLSEGEKVNE